NNNALQQLPPEIGQLSALKYLHLQNNALQQLPPEIGQLSALLGLNLLGNPGLGLPPEVVKDRFNPRAILDYYFSKVAASARPLNEVKLLLVGRGGSGKTSIVERLVHQRFNPGEESTTGIALQDWELQPNKAPSTKNKAPITAHIWDFAGQVIAHATHQFFLSARSVYVLVLTAREDSQREDAEYWLRLIRAFGTDRETKDVSRVIVALNKWESDPVKIDREALREKYPFIVGFVETDCKSGLGIEKLQQLLAETAAADRWVTDPVGKEFFSVKNALSERWKTGTGTSYLDYAEFERICVEKGGVAKKDAEKRKNLAVQLHCLGLALNYGDDPRLRDTTVLNPHWVTDGIYELLRRAPNERGVLSLDAASRQLPDEPAPMVLFLIRLMEKYDLAFPLRERDQLWLVPQALPDQQPKLDLEKWHGEKATRLRWTYAALPEGLVARFITRTHTLSEGRGCERWLNGVILELAGAEALIRADPAERRIEAVAVGADKKERQELAGLVQMEMRELNAEIQGLDPIEEMRMEGTAEVWVSTTGLEEMERSGQVETALMVTPSGGIEISPVAENNRLSAPDARDERVWKPRVFVSYAHEDDAAKDQLLLKLKVLRNAGMIDVWTDRDLSAGEEWNRGIGEQLAEMDVFVLLVSDHSLTSDFIQREELRLALERRAAGEVEVIPVIWQRCSWKVFDELKALIALPKDGKPIREHKPQAEGWHEVSEGLRKVFERLKKQRRVT
ncbi:MAG: internalin A, partial [Verrucomicrobiales bacterium]